MISGKVQDATTRQPLPGAHVYWQRQGQIDTTTATTTDLNGDFQIQHASGDLKITFIGYNPLTVPGAQLQGIVQRTFSLDPASNVLPEIEITAAKPKNYRWLIIVLVFSAAIAAGYYLRKKT